MRGAGGGFSSLFFFPGAPSKIDEQIIVFIDDLLFVVGLVLLFTTCTKVYVTGLSSAHE